MYCTNCGQIIRNGAGFCGYCGAQTNNNYFNFCSICGCRVNPQNRFCANCGNAYYNTTNTVTENNYNYNNNNSYNYSNSSSNNSVAPKKSHPTANVSQRTKSASKFKRFLASKAGEIVLCIIFAIIIFGTMVAVVNASNNEYVVLGIGFIYAYFGWKSLTKITPNIFLFLPVIGWVIYFVVKFVLSVIIGMFVAPIWIGRKISAKVSEGLYN